MPAPRANRLALSASPYLLQHAHNPVDWYPWGEEALQKAKAEDKPIFLSVGYSACHWCHVMERESFESLEVADLLNEHFVPVKVDREERPDLDDLYMGVVQAITGRGGWPMSVWLTPDRKPFYGGTYFPPEPRFGSPGFLQVLQNIASVWRERRNEVVEDSRRLAESLERQAWIEPGHALPADTVFDEALEQLRRTFDVQWGGFGPAPKFPPFLAVDFILRRGEKRDRPLALRTLDAMSEGGLFDHLGGGFARYSVDTRWLVPHFEKMLYDNAQLASTYLSAFLGTGDARYAEVARATLDYLLRDMRDGSGGFHSSEDADSEGEEGRFYVFTPAQVRSALGEADGALFCEAFGVSEQGCFEGGKSVLHRFSAPRDLAERRGFSPKELEEKLRLLCARLREERSRRVRPHKDDKVLASWNGLVISAMARGFQVLRDPRYLEAAVICAELLRREFRREGRLLRVWRRGQTHTSGFLEDYAAVILGLVDLYEAGFDPRWLRWAQRLGDVLRERFEDSEAGGFYSTESIQKDVLFRQKPIYDGSMPSGNGLAVLALLRLGRHLDRDDFRNSAERALACFAPNLERAPRALLGLLAGLEFARTAPLEIVLAGPREDPRTMSLMEVAWNQAPFHRTLALANTDPDFPLHAERRTVEGIPAAHVCINRACLEPVTSPKALESLLSRELVRHI